MRDLLAALAFRALLTFFRILPIPIAFAVARLCLRGLDILVPRLRRTALRNLSLALPEADAHSITNGVFASLSRMMVAFARFPDIHRHNIGKWIRYEGLEYFQQAHKQGRGVLFATAHLGAWELSAFAHALMTEPMHIVVRPIDNSSIDGIVARRRAMSGNTLVAKKDAARSIVRALRNGDAVGVLIDQNVSEAEGVFVDFFGIKACAGTAFVRLAARTGAAVIPGFALWSEAERKYILRFYQPIEISGDIHKDTQSLQKCLENVIREYPDQWLWLHRRWKTRPRGSSQLY